jgi:exportin-2 (importin alpha re-exporter)
MACELVKGLSSHYREQVTGMFTGYIQTMIQEYAANPVQNWKAKDCAIYLVVSLAQRQASVGAVASDLVNFEQFFSSQIVPELRAQDVNSNALLKADALKFVTTFRTQIPKHLTLELMPQLIGFLVAESNVVHSYAALAIEKLLAIKDGKQSRYTGSDLTPFLQPLFINLFGALKLPESQENAYVMRCIMRVLSIADIGPFAPQCLGELANILMVVCKNPSNPSFNHYLFEAVAALLRNACEKDPGQVATFENQLFPVFQAVLEQDVTEFAPYVFQIMAQLIESRRPPLPQIYIAFFPPLLTPLLWQRQANVPGLVRLLQAYLQKAPQEINKENQLMQVLGVFEKLVASKNTDHQGFFILNTVVENLSYEALSPFMAQIWNILFSRLQYRSTGKFIKSLIIFASLFSVKHGSGRVIETINAVQPNLFASILDKIWIPNLTTISGDIETKLCAVAATMLVAPLFQSSQEIYVGKLVNSVMTLLVKPEEDRVEEDKDVPDMDEVAGYVAVYAQLHNAAKREDDPLKDIKDPKEFVAKTLAGVSQQYPKLSSIIQQGLEAGNMTALAQFCSAYGVSIV